MLVLANYPRLSERLHEIIGRDEIPDNICFFSPEIQADLCEIFLQLCGESLKYEIYQEILDTDEITKLLVNYRENVSFATIALQDHLTNTVHKEAALYINDLLGQVKNGL